MRSLKLTLLTLAFVLTTPPAQASKITHVECEIRLGGEETSAKEEGGFILGVSRLGVGRLGGAPREDLEAKKAARDLIQFVQKLSESVGLEMMAGASTPSWDQFENLQDFVNAHVQPKTEISSSRILMAMLSMPEFTDISSKLQVHGAGIDGKNYGPIDFGVRQAFRNELEKLPGAVGPWLKAILYPLPADTKKPSLKKQAEELLVRQNQIFEKVFSTSGFESLDALKKDLPKTYWSKAILEESYELAIFRPTSGRWWIDKVGFHNQHVTGSSYGALNPKMRNRVERTRLEMSADDYDDLDADLKPKYGLMTKGRNELKQASSYYGNDVYLLKKDRVKNRTTITLGDSLNGYAKVTTPAKWNDFFAPLGYASLVAPFFNENSDEHDLESTPSVPVQFNTALNDRNYPELQYFGPLTLDDVDAFIFTKDDGPPSGNFLKALLTRKIKIFTYSEDTNKLIPYVPTEEGK